MDLIGHWYYHLPNYALAVFIYTLLGRFILGMFVPEEWPNYIWQAFKALTRPVLLGIRFITPAAVPVIWLPLIGVFWLTTLRVGFTLVMAAHGLVPVLPVAR
ncbi:MAG: YggT family protein [Alphaproteobacteria bacterium]